MLLPMAWWISPVRLFHLFFSFRIRSLNLIRAVGFGKSTEGPAKEVVLARWALGHRTREAALPCKLPLLSGALRGKPGGCLLAGCISRGTVCRLLRLSWLLALQGGEELRGCCTSSCPCPCPCPCPCLCLHGPDSPSCPAGYRKKGIFLRWSQYRAGKHHWCEWNGS